MGDSVVIDRVTGKILRQLDPGRFEMGKPLPGALCDVHGKTLMPAGFPLDPADVKRLRGQIRRGVYGGDDWPAECFLDHAAPAPVRSPAAGAAPAHDLFADPAAAPPAPAAGTRRRDLITVGLDTLYVGKTLAYPMFNRNGVLLLAAGMEVTHSFLGRLRQQGVYEVQIPADTSVDRYQPTAGRIRAERELDNLVEHLRRTELTIGGHVLPRRDVPLGQLREEAQRGHERFVRCVDDVAEIASDVLRGRSSTIVGASDVLTPFMEMTSTDSSLLPIIAQLRSSPGEYLYQHGLNVALLAMAAAARLGVRKEILLEIGLGALLQDVGMLRIEESIRLAPRALTPEERSYIREHPHYSLDMLNSIEGLGSVSLLICYQAHERNDGTGYPNRRPRKQIHPFARLVAAADVYTAIASHRPHRPAQSPYKAMETVLREASRNLLDAEVVRNFLNCLALFPIGSHVRLSTGETARVVRANPSAHTLPVVVLLDEDGRETNTEIDLAATDYAVVLQALDFRPSVPTNANVPAA